MEKDALFPSRLSVRDRLPSFLLSFSFLIPFSFSVFFLSLLLHFLFFFSLLFLTHIFFSSLDISRLNLLLIPFILFFFLSLCSALSTAFFLSPCLPTGSMTPTDEDEKQQEPEMERKNAEKREGTE